MSFFGNKKREVKRIKQEAEIQRLKSDIINISNKATESTRMANEELKDRTDITLRIFHATRGRHNGN